MTDEEIQEIKVMVEEDWSFEPKGILTLVFYIAGHEDAI